MQWFASCISAMVCFLLVFFKYCLALGLRALLWPSYQEVKNERIQLLLSVWSLHYATQRGSLPVLRLGCLQRTQD